MRILAVITALAVLLGGCRPAQENSYTGTAEGYGGSITVTVTVEDGALTGVRVDAEGETGPAALQALEQLPAAILGTGSPWVAGVAGATETCRGIRQGAAAALRAAGLDPGEEGGLAVRTESREAELVVIGAGAAGLTAACDAAEAGRAVLLLERGGTLGGRAAALPDLGGESGDRYTGRLVRRLGESGAVLLAGTEMTGLILRDGAVTGVRAAGDGVNYTLTGPVVLATGSPADGPGAFLAAVAAGAAAGGTDWVLADRVLLPAPDRWLSAGGSPLTVPEPGCWGLWETMPADGGALLTGEELARALPPGETGWAAGCRWEEEPQLFGALATDAEGRVLRRDGTAIPGLYAAGAAAAGWEPESLLPGGAEG